MYIVCIPTALFSTPFSYIVQTFPNIKQDLKRRKGNYSVAWDRTKVYKHLDARNSGILLPILRKIHCSKGYIRMISHYCTMRLEGCYLLARSQLYCRKSKTRKSKELVALFVSL